MSDQPPNKAAKVAATAAARRALREAAALRANLQRRKQQARALAIPKDARSDQPAEPPEPCR